MALHASPPPTEQNPTWLAPHALASALNFAHACSVNLPVSTHQHTHIPIEGRATLPQHLSISLRFPPTASIPQLQAHTCTHLPPTKTVCKPLNHPGLIGHLVHIPICPLGPCCPSHAQQTTRLHIATTQTARKIMSTTIPSSPGLSLLPTIRRRKQQQQQEASLKHPQSTTNPPIVHSL